MMNFGRLYSLTIAASLMLSSCNEGGRGNGVRFANDPDEAAGAAKTEKLNIERQRDADFVFETVANQYGEIKLCELAIQRSHNAGIREAAERLQKDHAASLNALKVLAQAKAVSIPVEEDNDTKRAIERFAGESGSEFDKEWCSHMLDMHTESIKKYEKRLDDTADPELKSFLKENLSILKDHYTSLKACSDKTQALPD